MQEDIVSSQFLLSVASYTVMFPLTTTHRESEISLMNEESIHKTSLAFFFLVPPPGTVTLEL